MYLESYQNEQQCIDHGYHDLTGIISTEIDKHLNPKTVLSERQNNKKMET